MRRSRERTRDAYVLQLSEPDSRRREQAAVKIGALGISRALPQLAAVLKSDPDVHVRSCAAYGLGKSGARARPFIPDLFEALFDPAEKVQHWARLALKDLGRPARKHLRKQLLGRVPARRVAAMVALSKHERFDWSMVYRYAKHKSARARTAALQTIGAAAPDGAAPRALVRRCLGDADREVRWAARWAASRIFDDPSAQCTEFDTVSAELLPLSLAMAAHDDIGYRRMALNHLTASGDTSAPVVAMIVEALDDPETIDAALGADWPVLGQAAVPALIELLGRSVETDQAASGALYCIGWAAIPALREALDRDLPAEQEESAWAIMQRIAAHDDPADSDED